MQRLRYRPKVTTRRPALPPGGERRRGTVLIVVMGLLGLLMLLGFAFYSFAKQEEGNAEYFNARARQVEEFVSADVLFNWGMEQLILGAPAGYKNSALFGGRHSLLPNMMGTDIAPYSGRGINLGYNATTGGFFVDQNFDGQADNPQLLVLADSPSAVATAADVGTQPGGQNYTGFPAPDTDYTYPDINNAFLALNALGLNGMGQPIRTIIPSFLCPQLYRALEADGVMRPLPSEDLNLNGQFDAGEDRNGNGQLDDWYLSTDTRRLVLRPHAQHMHVAPDGTVLGRRYLLSPNSYTQYGVAPFPMHPHASGPASGWGADAVPGEMGVWSVAPWRPSSPYKQGEVIVPRSTPSPPIPGWGFLATNDGTSGATGSEPVWGTGGPVNDNGIVWRPVLLGSGARPHYEFDADADGDGIKEAVWLDLDFPVQTAPDGTNRKFIPLFAFTVYDADGLLNLLAHGNLEGFVQFRQGGPGSYSPFGADTNGDGITENNAFALLSRSNLGASINEVNPLWGLTGGFSGLSGNTTQHQYFFGRSPQTWQELANMEWFLSRVGKLEYDTASGNDYTVTDRYHGLYGEIGSTINVGTTNPRPDNLGITAFPGPGQPGFDDNGNSLLVGEPTATYNSYRTWRQPLDYLGLGRDYDTTGRAPLTVATSDPTGAAGRWLGFANYPTQRSPSTIGWSQYTPGGQSLMGQYYAPLMDEAYELNPDHADAIYINNPNPVDELMPIADIALLQMDELDVKALDLMTARTGRLFEYNFRFSGSGGTGNPDAEAIRQRFTTLSSDLKTFGTSFYNDATSSGSQRRWEFTQTGTSPVTYEFPPYFLAALDPNSDLEPFRPALRQALQTLPNNRTAAPSVWRQRALNMNGVTYVPNGGSNSKALTPHDSAIGNTTVTPVPFGTDPSPASAAYTASSQEARARYDRQMMARDIYVMLYTLGGGQDGVDYTTSNNILTDMSGTKIELPTSRQRDLDNDGTVQDHEIKFQRRLYDDDQLHEMAQFAINAVDRLDPDNVIDRFEYDKDLVDGWSLDDDPYDVGANSGDPNLAQTENRSVVLGVETQELTFGEIAAFATAKVTAAGNPKNLDPTGYDDQHDHYWSYIELRNAAPFASTLQGQWRIELEFIESIGASPPSPRVVDKRRILTLGRTATPISLGGGEPLTILSKAVPDAGPSATFAAAERSAFQVDLAYEQGVNTLSFDSPQDIVVPYQAASNGNSTRLLDLLQSTNYTLQNQVGTNYKALLNVNPGDPTDSLGELLKTSPAAGVTRKVRFVLKRRANLDRPTVADDEDNPWVVVDVMSFGSWTIPVLKLDQNDVNGYDVAEQIDRDNAGQSRQRGRRLDRGSETMFGGGDPGVGGAATLGTPTSYKTELVTSNNPEKLKFHTLGIANSNQTYDLYQIHGDRDYHSVSELLTVPLYGPGELTTMLNGGASPGAIDAFQRGENTAGAERFLRPMPPSVYGISLFGADTVPGTATAGMPPGDDDGDGLVNELDEVHASGSDDRSTQYDNRWYRLLELWEVPSAVDGAGELRSHGLVNLNGLRHPEVLAGLIDDPHAFNFAGFNPLREGSQNTYLPDRREGNARDWWIQFLLARDGGIDPVSGLVLPGSAGAQPFRPLNFAGNKSESLEDTVLRPLLNDGLNVQMQQPSQYMSQQQPTRGLFELRQPVPTVKTEFGSQHRLLSKLLNNTTTRSNVFFVFVQVDFFEVLEVVGDSTPNSAVDPDTNIDVPPNYVLQKIGGKLPESPGHRGFFVIDRSLALAPDPNAPGQTRLKAQDLPRPYNAVSNPAAFTIQQSFDFRDLIRHRLIIK